MTKTPPAAALRRSNITTAQGSTEEGPGAVDVLGLNALRVNVLVYGAGRWSGPQCPAVRSTLPAGL
ncbi:hypothetical protein AB4Y88_03505 [Paenarthrobacter sp. RAF9]